jgi:uncharacterized protein
VTTTESVAGSVSRERFELPAPGGLRIRGEAVFSHGATTSVLVLHGFKGFYKWAFFPRVAEAICKAGTNAISFNFSGSGVGEDLESFTELDAFRSDSYTRQLDDLMQIVQVFGHSRGGAVALLHAVRSERVGALATWAAISDVLRWSKDDVRRWRERGYVDVPNVRTGQILQLDTTLLDEVDQLGNSALDLIAAARRMRAPWLIVHGTGDETVGFAEAERLSDAAPPETTQLLLIEKASHTFDVKHPLVGSSQALDRALEYTVAFYREKLLGELASVPAAGEHHAE